MNKHDNNQNSAQDISKDIANQSGKVVGKFGKKLGREARKQAGRFIKRQVAKLGAVAIKAIGAVFIKLLPIILIIALIVGIIILGWYLLFEIRGAGQTYSYERGVEENQRSVANDGRYYVATDLSQQNKEIKRFYEYYGQRAFMQILTDDNEKLEITEGEDAIRDYYEKEKEFSINPNFLWALDEFALKGKYIYPEQWVLPVPYDPETLELIPLTNDDGELTMESTKYNELDTDELIEAREKVKTKTFEVEGRAINATDDMEIGVHDYGFGSIFKYKEDELIKTVEGRVYKREIWDSECECKVEIDVDEEFEYELPGYPQKIWLITRAITFRGETDFIYETQKNYDSDLTDTIGPRASNAIKAHYSTHYITDEVCNSEGECETVIVEEIPLYEYREGAVFATVPVEIDSEVNDHGNQYLYDYLMNMKIWVPESVLDGFNFKDRMGNVLYLDMQLGGATDSDKFKYVYQNYLEVVTKYSNIYGVDPFIILAKLTQESGGQLGHKHGPFQITGGSRTVEAKNMQTGKYESFTIHPNEKNDVEKATRWAVMYYASKLEKFEGDPLKALQSYNFDVGIIKKYLEEKGNPDGWYNGEWMQVEYLEKAREEHGKNAGYGKTRSVNYSCAPHLAKDTSLFIYGDVCYIHNVLRYYAGDQLLSTKVENPNDNDNGDKGLLSGLLDNILSFVGIKKPEYAPEEPRIPFEHLMSEKEVDDFLKSIKTFDDRILFSAVDGTHYIKFWDDGFSSLRNSANISVEEFMTLTGNAKFYPPLNIKNPLVSSHYGMRINPITGKKELHRGIDISVPAGTPIYAIADGVIDKVDHYESTGWGKYIRIKLDNMPSRALYAHLDDIFVKEGQHVTQGQLIGLTGNTGASTGPHLHLEFWLDGTYGNTINPYHIVVQPELFD